MARRKNRVSEASISKGPEAERDYFAEIKKTLKALGELREEQERWDDSEVERPEETLSCKTSEALYCFILPRTKFPTEFGNPFIYVKKELFLSDIEKLLGYVKSGGFYPSPYTYFPGPFQYTDFAAFLVRFLLDSKVFLLHEKSVKKGLITKIEEIIEKSLAFIEKSVRKTKSNGYGWAGTELTEAKFKDKRVVDYTNTFSTSSVISAIGHFLKSPHRDVNQVEKEKWTDFIAQGGTWLDKRIKDKLYCGNVENTRSEINFTTHALKGIFNPVFTT